MEKHIHKDSGIIHYTGVENDLKAQVEALEEMLTECTCDGELDSRLFNSYMEHVIKSK